MNLKTILKRLFFPVLFFATLQSSGEGFRLSQDLSSHWQIYRDGKWVNYSGQATNTIHVPLDFPSGKGKYLKIESHGIFYLFINNSLVAKSVKFYLSADSLRGKYQGGIFVSIFQPGGVSDLATSWVTSAKNDMLFNPPRPPRSFSNFILLASLVLVIFFTALFRTNAQLTLDYLDFTKLFYFKDRDESQITLRITSSVNLLFYLFCSLLSSLALLTASHYSSGGLSFLSRSSSFTTIDNIFHWVVLALIILGLLLAKFAFVALLALLYDWRDVAGFQFFNFVRVLILSLMVIAFVSIFCFSLGIDFSYFSLLKWGCGMLALGVGLLFFKLLRRSSFSSFHLFSYLCVAEVFPLMILIKIILF